MKTLPLAFSLLLVMFHADGRAKHVVSFTKPTPIDNAFTCPANSFCAVNLKVKRHKPIETTLQCAPGPRGEQFIDLYETRSKGQIRFDGKANGVSPQLKIKVTNTTSTDAMFEDRKKIGAILHFCCGPKPQCGKNYR